MDAGLLLGVRVLDQVELGLRVEVRDLGNRNEVVDLLTLVFEVEAGISECGREVDDGLADFMDLLLRRDLEKGPC